MSGGERPTRKELHRLLVAAIRAEDMPGAATCFGLLAVHYPDDAEVALAALDTAGEDR